MTSKTIVITDASDGIGAVAARRQSRNGDKVVVAEKILAGELCYRTLARIT
jgi:NAD(P)-dependent dehydrogenase (short-subunit alcohol dehydrogenase family)